METCFIRIYALITHTGIDLEVSMNTTLQELCEMSARFMEKETYGQFLAHSNNYLVRCCNRTFMKGSYLLYDIDVHNGECFYLF